MKILDLTAGNRAIWYDKKNPLTTFVDKRESVEPDILWDIMKPKPDVLFGERWDLLVFDPPHKNCGPNSNMSKVYGHHTTEEILKLIERVDEITHIIATDSALMALKWNSADIKLQRVFDLLTNWEPLFGHLTKDGPRSQTYWVMLRRR